MARSSRSRLPGMSRAAKIAGWCWLPVYLVGLNVLLGWLNDALRLGMDGVTVNIVYFAVNLAAVLIIFHSFLRQPFFGGGFWDFLQALILGAAIHYGGTFVIDWAAQRLSISLTLFNNDTVSELLTGGGTVMTIATVLAAPIIEETLVRGLVFGTIRDASRLLAYIVSILVFVFMHTWQYFLLYAPGAVLLSALPYIPAAAALCFAYEKSGSIWAAISLHAIINAVATGVLGMLS